MIQLRKQGEEARDSSSPKSVIPSNLTPMELNSPSYLQPSPLFSSNGMESPLEGDPGFYSANKENPFGDSFPDPLCKLNLKETSEFVRAFPMNSRNSTGGNRGLLETSAQRRRDSIGQKRLEAPSTPGRPVFNFSVGNLSRKGIPSKWDDAEKWLISSSCHESPAHVVKPSDPSKISKGNGVFHQKDDAFEEKMRVVEEKVSSPVLTGFDGAVSNLAFHGVSSEVFLKDKFTDNVEPIFPNFRFSEPAKEGFLFKSSFCDPTKDGATKSLAEVHHRDIGTEMTPLGSSATSRCHTPIKNSSPARHNTPADRSGPLIASNNCINITELKDYHFEKLELGAQFDSMVSNWSSREEEEEEISKSLRHFEMGGGRKSIGESRASAWEDEERTKNCIRYQREEAKIEAWVNLQKAKAEAQSRKLEVKIQKMRSDLEEKLMKRMAIVQRRAEEWRAAAQLQHSQQILRASEQAQKLKTQHRSHFSDFTSCGCFPCNNHL